MRILGFNKMKNLLKKAAHGFSDQMHLIKDLKEFANNTPFNFFKNTPPLRKKILKVE